jgi:hypothetical protein
MTETNLTPFEVAFDIFFAGCKRIYTDYCNIGGYSIRDEFRCEVGKRYVKVVRGGGVHCFVDKTTGDVLKPASWKAPAKHARGNIFDAKNGLASMGPHGPAYLR